MKRQNTEKNWWTDEDNRRWSGQKLKREFKEYQKHLGIITMKYEMLFYNQSRFVPVKRSRGNILNRRHGLYVGMTKMKLE